MKQRIFIGIAVLVLVVGFVLFWNGPHEVRGSGSDIIVLCSSCTYPGLPQEAHLVLMDANSGEIWMYNDQAIAGKQLPIHWGKLTLGQPVARAVVEPH